MGHWHTFALFQSLSVGAKYPAVEEAPRPTPLGHTSQGVLLTRAMTVMGSACCLGVQIAQTGQFRTVWFEPAQRPSGWRQTAAVEREVLGHARPQSDENQLTVSDR